METININIEGRIYAVDKSMTVLEAARSVGYNIPTLCYWKGGHNSLASCRVCLVEIATARGGKLFASCVYPVADVPAEKGFVIKISSPMAVEARRASVELLLSNHNQDCQACVDNFFFCEFCFWWHNNLLSKTIVLNHLFYYSLSFYCCQVNLYKRAGLRVSLKSVFLRAGVKTHCL